ncbi:MAG: hypothetical protein ACOYXT_07690 [Bacteroidota bacterium]
MKKIIFSLLIVSMIVVSCEDKSLDPLQFDSVKKGTILALRGTALNKIYVQGKPAAELFPKIATGTEKFDFDAEFLAENVNTLASMDIYVIKRVGSAREKVFLKNVLASEFKSTADYKRPWVSQSLSIVDVVKAIGLSGTFPLSAGEINTLLTTYQFGVQLEIDLNLTDGTKVFASDLVAAGLFQSNQFYPAQKLTWAMTDYCSYNASSWLATFAATENRSTVYGPYDVTLTADPGGNPNRFFLSNFYDCGDVLRYVDFAVSSDPATQVVTFPSQTTATGTVSGTGTYNQCLGSFSIEVTYDYTAASCNGAAGQDKFRYDFTKK